MIVTDLEPFTRATRTDRTRCASMTPTCARCVQPMEVDVDEAVCRSCDTRVSLDDVKPCPRPATVRTLDDAGDEDWQCAPCAAVARRRRGAS